MIEQAALLQEKTVSDFVLDKAFEAAQQIIAERTHFKLSAEQWEAFCQALDAPARAIPALRRLLTKPGVFDEQR